MSFEDIEAIKRVKYNYCNGIDRCDLALLESIMTEDVEIDYERARTRSNAFLSRRRPYR